MTSEETVKVVIQIAEQTGSITKALENILKEVENIKDQIENLAANAQEQSAAAEEMSGAMDTSTKSTMSIAQLIEEMTQSVKQQADTSQDISKYK